MPEDAPPAKVDATRGYGAEIVRYDRWTERREEIGARLAAERGLELVRPYDDPLVMAGQGTTALELLDETPELDVLVVPVGGGGLIAGCATAAKALRPSIRVVGVEPEAGDDTRRSLAAGERVRIDVPRTIADGLQSDEPGRADVRGEPPARRRDRDRHGRRDPRRDGVPVRPDEGRDRAERSGRRRRPDRRPHRRGRRPRRRRRLGRERRRGAVRRAARPRARTSLPARPRSRRRRRRRACARRRRRPRLRPAPARAPTTSRISSMPP